MLGWSCSGITMRGPRTKMPTLTAASS
jgi:hypothetical protein